MSGIRHLFHACEIEIGYALVDRLTLDVLPVAERVLQEASGSDRPTALAAALDSGRLFDP